MPQKTPPKPQQQQPQQKPKPKPEPSLVNTFNNDGSFLDQFKKLSEVKKQVKLEPVTQVRPENVAQVKFEPVKFNPSLPPPSGLLVLILTKIQMKLRAVFKGKRGCKIAFWDLKLILSSEGVKWNILDFCTKVIKLLVIRS